MKDRPSIVNVDYRSTNFWVVSAGWRRTTTWITPGHSDDSIAVLLDSGEACTGDLTWPMLATEETMDQVMPSWECLRALGARTVYAGRGPVRPMPTA